MKLSLKEVLARRSPLSVVFVTVGLLGTGGWPRTAAASAGLSTLANAPLYFEAGRPGGPAQFIARGAACSVRLAPTEADIILAQPAERPALRESNATRSVRLQLVGANGASRISGRDALSAKANYFIGNEPAQWQTGIPLFAKVQVDEVYPGVRVVYYANQSAQLEYDFLLQPGARPGQVRFHVAGADKVRVDEAGNLALKIGDSEIRQHQPVAYQKIDGVRREIPASYRLNPDGTIGFTLAEYDRSRPLVIDPVLDFLTYMGGRKMDIGWAIALDGSGNVYVAGETLSTGLPTTNAIQFGTTDFSRFRGGNNSFGDAFVAKYDTTGALQFLTYLGGRNDDGALGIAFDTNNDVVWVTGFTDSANFPLRNPLRPALTGPAKNAKHIFTPDAFIVKLDPSGTNLLYSTYFGGENIDEGMGITVDASGSVYATGIASSTNLPGLLPNAFQTRLGGKFDAFITKLIPIGENIYTNAYTTYLGGRNTEYGLSIAVDSGLRAWVTGLTFSTNFYTANAIQLTNAFFPEGHAFTDLNTQAVAKKHNGAFNSDAFVTEISADGASAPFSTYLGGTNDDVGEHITVDASDNVYVTGFTFSREFPTNRIAATPVPDVTNQIVFPHPGTNFISHVFVTEFVNQALAYSVHFGGSRADEGFGIAVDGAGLTYVAGSTSSTNFFQMPLLVTNTAPGKNDPSITKYFGILTNSPVFTDLSNTNLVGKAKHHSNSNDVFVVVLSPEFTNFVQTMRLAGPGQDDVNGIAVDPSGSTVYIVGSTTSKTNFATPNAAQELFSGGKNGGQHRADAFVGKILISP